MIRTVLGFAALVVLSATPRIAEARVGGLDPSFGDRGRVTTSLSFAAPSDFAVGPEGSIVFEHGDSIERLLPNGETDVGFGDQGAIRLPETVEGLKLLGGLPVIDSKGRIIVFALATDPAVVFLEPTNLLSARSSWPVVLRLMPNGDLDNNFGEGKGFVRSDFGISSSFETDISLVEIANGLVDSQDRPIFVIRSAALTGRCNYGHTAMAAAPRAVVRLTNGGAPDPTFGGGDGVSPVYGAEWESALELDDADQPVVALPTENCKKGGNRIFRFDSGGLPIAEFGSQGSMYYPGLLFSTIEPGGQLLLQRGASRAEAVARTDLEGNLDPTFGVNGIAPVKMPKGADRRLRPVGVDMQRRIIFVGSLSFPLPRKHPDRKSSHHHKKRPSRSYVVITRLTPAGKIDLSFGNRGWVTTRFNRPQHLQVDQATLDSQGRLVVEVGSNDARQKPGTHLVIARYLLNG